MGGCPCVEEVVFVSERTDIKKLLGSLQTVVLCEKLKIPFRDVLIPTIEQKLKKQVCAITMIYRASKHAFSASKFHKKTHGIPYTILLVKNEHGMIFGGFTRCSWQDNIMYKYSKDEEKSSFVFRINSQQFEEEKGFEDYVQMNGEIEMFDLVEEEFAIMNTVQDGPIFGSGYDIFICDRCHKFNSWAKMGHAYASKYSFDTKKANNLLGGKRKFKIVEYEIFAVNFAQLPKDIELVTDENQT